MEVTNNDVTGTIIMTASLSRLVVAGLLLLSSVAVLKSATVKSNDMRYVSYQEMHLELGVQMYHNESIDHYQHVIFDTVNDQIIAGARNHLVRLSISELNVLGIIPWFARDSQVEMCFNMGQPESECQNYIKVLLVHNGSLLSCGTNAHEPNCTWRHLSSLNEVTGWTTGKGKCPYSPSSNNSFVISDRGDLYSALLVDSGGLDWAIMRTLGLSNSLRTAKSNSLWLDRPEFVAMFDIDEYVYVFFREVAVDQIACGKLIVSRVARVCKSDHGGNSWTLKHNWVTFVKARLNCSRPGEYPFYYNELQSIYFDEARSVFTGIFTTPPNSLYGSAVCEYTLEEMKKVFQGPFKEYIPETLLWRTTRREHSIKCPSPKPGLYGVQLTLSHLDFMEAGKLQLIDPAVQPTQPHPLIEVPSERFSHILTEQIDAVYEDQPVSLTTIYMTTFEGLIKKYIVLPGQRMTSCLLEVIQLLPPDLPQPIKLFRINPVTKRLIVGTNTRIYQIAKERCFRYKTQMLCESVQDPYCRWDQTEQKCVSSSSSSSFEPTIISSCPLADNLRRNWYGWSDWSECSATCGDGIQMRMLVCLEDINRLATSPDLKHALRCSGTNHVTKPCKLRNCTDGAVSPWSSWMNNKPTNTLEGEREENGDGDRYEKRYRCFCENAGVNRCKAHLQIDERTCKFKGQCSSRLKRLVGKKNRRTGELFDNQTTASDGQSFKKCSQELIEKNEENIKMKKHLEEMEADNRKSEAATFPTSPIRIEVTIKNSGTSSIGSANRRHHDGTTLVRSNGGDTLDDRANHLPGTSGNVHHPPPPPSAGPDKATRRRHLPISRLYPLNKNIYYNQKTAVLLTTPAPTTSPCPAVCPQFLPPEHGVFYGYCGCRDMGLFRVCQKCNGRN